jgi:hypothetical protein
LASRLLRGFVRRAHFQERSEKLDANLAVAHGIVVAYRFKSACDTMSYPARSECESDFEL